VLYVFFGPYFFPHLRFLLISQEWIGEHFERRLPFHGCLSAKEATGSS